MSKTTIEWTDARWNPIRGCSRVSEGCRNCYAERMAARFSRGKRLKPEHTAPALPYHGLAEMTPQGPRWTGKVALVEEHLKDPLRWKLPRRVFVNSMSDLFNESVPDSWIDRIFTVMQTVPRHTFQVLTKRAERMCRYMKGRQQRAGELRGPVAPDNLWLGVSAEDQQTFKARVPLLLATPAAVRWVSIEPMLEGVELHDGFWKTTRDHTDEYDSVPLSPRLDWVVIGGESGPGARMFHLDSAYEMIGECEEAGVPVFLKQFGAKPVTWNANRFDWPNDPMFIADAKLEGAASARVVLRDRKGGDMAEWPEEFRVRQFPRVAVPA